MLLSYDRETIETTHKLEYSTHKLEYSMKVTSHTLVFSKSTIHYELQCVHPYSGARIAPKGADSKRKHFGCILTLTVENKKKSSIFSD